MQLTSTQEKMVEAAEIFLWADVRDYSAWMSGKWERSKTAEYNLPRMVKKGVLVQEKLGKRKVYRLKGKRGINKSNIKHGLIATKALLLFLMSMVGEVISESFMRTLQLEVIPEWGIRYEESTLFLEFSTADNFRRTALMTDKLRRYRRTMRTLGQHFNSEPVVLNIYETSRAQVEAFVNNKTKPEDWGFYFIDLETFWNIPVGDLFTTKAFMSPVVNEPVGLSSHA